MHIYKPKYTDPKTKERRESGVWWIKFYVEGRKKPIRRSLRTRDKRAATAKALRIVEQAERGAQGLTTDCE